MIYIIPLVKSHAQAPGVYVSSEKIPEGEFEIVKIVSDLDGNVSMWIRSDDDDDDE